MSCYHPLKAFAVGLHDSGKPNYRIVPYDTHHVEKMPDGSFRNCFSEFVSPYSVRSYRDSVDLPCGKCIGCRLDYSRSWANRCMLEAQYHESSYFVTLTYDNDHLHFNPHEIDPDTGEILNDSATLFKKDLQDFMKRLRKNYKYDNPIRFYACGEYGEHTKRPHYHALLFGLKLDDLVFYKSNNGYTLYTSDFLQRTWKNGYVVVGNLNWDTCAYTARYIMKKHKGQDSHFYDDHNISPEFVVMSRKPGIAYQYFEEHQDQIYSTDKIYLSDPKGGREIKPSRYYDNLFDIEHHDRLEQIKVHRKLKAEAYKSQMLSQTDLPYLDALQVQERVKTNKIKSLKRNLD